jgi:hypothetical protein
MYSEKFLKFIEIWQKEFAFERTLDEETALDAQGRLIPWYTYPAIEYLSQFDYRNKKIFEYGCANSSVFWAQRAASVVSIENDAVWFEKWKTELKADHLTIKLREKEAYEKAVFESGEKYDVIIVDGIRRLECAKAAAICLKDEGMIILDDSDRAKHSAEYRQIVGLLKERGLLQIDFYGFCPMNVYPKTTSVFLTRNFNFPLLEEIQPSCGIGSLWGMPRRIRKSLYRSGLK